MEAPALPRLNLMLQREDLYPQLPEELTKTWAQHVRHSEAFRKLANAIVEEWGPLPVDTKKKTVNETGAAIGYGRTSSEEVEARG